MRFHGSMAGAAQDHCGDGILTEGQHTRLIPSTFPASAKLLDFKEGFEALEAGLYARPLPGSWTAALRDASVIYSLCK